MAGGDFGTAISAANSYNMPSRKARRLKSIQGAEGLDRGSVGLATPVNG